MENINSDKNLHLWHGDELYVATVFHLVVLNQGETLLRYNTINRKESNEHITQSGSGATHAISNKNSPFIWLSVLLPCVTPRP